jgi:hypothetical protein
MHIPILTLILVWNGRGRCNPADCNHHVSFRTWHFLCKKTRLSEARRRAGTPDRNSRLVRAMFPSSGARLSCNHHSNAESVWLLNIAQEAHSSLMPNRCRVCPQALSKTEQFWADTKSSAIVTWMHSRDGNRARLGSPQSLPCGAAWASKFLNLQPQYRPLRRILLECPRAMAQA